MSRSTSAGRMNFSSIVTWSSQSSPTCPKAISQKRRTEWVSPVAIDVVVGLVLLEHQPHRLDVVAGEAPVALGVEVAERQLVG